jgi:hypothetical protein
VKSFHPARLRYWSVIVLQWSDAVSGTVKLTLRQSHPLSAD